MDDASLPNSVAKDIASVLQVHFDIDGLDSPDLVRLDTVIIWKLDTWIPETKYERILLLASCILVRHIHIFKYDIF